MGRWTHVGKKKDDIAEKKDVDVTGSEDMSSSVCHS